MPIYGGSFAPTHGQTLGTVKIASYSPWNLGMDILKLDWSGIKREAIEVTNMNVQPTTTTGNFGNKMFIPSAYVDPGELKIQILHSPEVNIPIADWTKAGPTTITITLGPATSVQETFTVLGFVTEYDIDGPLDGKAVTATMTIKLTDAVSNSYNATGGVAWVTAS